MLVTGLNIYSTIFVAFFALLLSLCPYSIAVASASASAAVLLFLHTNNNIIIVVSWSLCHFTYLDVPQLMCFLPFSNFYEHSLFTLPPYIHTCMEYTLWHTIERVIRCKSSLYHSALSLCVLYSARRCFLLLLLMCVLLPYLIFFAVKTKVSFFYGCCCCCFLYAHW